MDRIFVKSYMTKKSTPEFDFMAKWNNDNPMPLREMVVDEYVKETRGMVYIKCHADILQRVTVRCMCCGRPLTNKVSQFFGLGIECGKHNYVNPFDTEEELNQAVADYREKLLNIKWEGWIIKSAILECDKNISINGETSDETVETIECKKNLTIDVEDNMMYLTFDYDTDVIESIRNLPVRRWVKETKQWEVPVKSINKIKSIFNSYDITINGEIKEEKHITIDDIKGFEYKTKPYEHQVDGVNYGLNNDKWLLGDEQGLGKTKQIIDLAVAKKLQKGYKHCLIICGVNGLKWNWANEVKTHSNESALILGQKVNKKGRIVIGATSDKIADLRRLNEIDEYFIITNIESLRNDEIIACIKSLVKDGQINMIAFDECHKAKNPTSQQGKALLKINAETMVAMSGTPLMNSPLDLYVPLKWLGYEGHSFYSFKNHYCEMGGYGGYEILGYKNLEQLQEQLDEIMLRRLKDDVLDLPEKTFIDEFVDMTPKQAIVYKEVSMDIQSNIDKIKSSPNPLAEMIRLRQATGYTGILSSKIQESAKLDRLEELVEEARENNHQVVVFSNWSQMTDIIVKRLNKKYSVGIVTGETKDEDRQSIKDDFQAGKTEILVGTIGALGTGFTLTSGAVVIFTDHPWNMAHYTQAVDRCHRIGQTKNLTIYNLMCKNTIDERIWELVKQKGELSDKIIDGVDISDKSSVVDYLLS